MSQYPTGNKAANAVERLFNPDIKTNSDRILLKICKLTAFVAFSGQLFDPCINKLHGGVQLSVIAILATSIVTFITTLCLLGIRSVGRAAGKRSLLAQIWYVLARVTLYILLPCGLVTLLLILWALVTHQPAFR